MHEENQGQPGVIDRMFLGLDKIVGFALFLITVVMLFAGVYQVLCRYLIKTSVPWTEELMRYLYVWLTMTGVGLALRRNAYIAIEIIYDWLKKKSRGAAIGIFCIVMGVQMAFFAFLSVYGIQYARSAMGMVSPVLRVSMGVAYLALPIGGFLGLLYSLNTIRLAVKGGDL